jgi:uncharacterized RDD family membrane protein YckC
MKNKKDLFYLVAGIIAVFFSLKRLLLDGSQEYRMIIVGLCLGMLFIYTSLKKDSKTTSEKFIEKENLQIPIWWQRFIGFIIDSTIISFIFLLTIYLIDETYNIRFDKIINPVILIIPFYAYYYFFLEFVFNTSIGKLIFNLRVISAYKNKELTLDQVLIRSLVRLIPIDIIFFFAEKPIGLHDIISKTVVIKKA